MCLMRESNRAETEPRPGVEASVNYATEKARIRANAEVDAADLIAVVEATGYTASVPVPPRTGDQTEIEPAVVACVSSANVADVEEGLEGNSASS